jgi:hypothetical protein
MKKWITYLSVGLIALAIPALMLFFSPWATAQDERGQCQKNCTDRYQECRRAANSNQAACKQAFDACRDACRAGNTNANGNSNGNMNGNANGNSNMGGNTNSGGNDNTAGNMNSGGNSNAGGNTNSGGNTNTNQPGVRRGRVPGTPRGPVNRNSNSTP